MNDYNFLSLKYRYKAKKSQYTRLKIYIFIMIAIICFGVTKIFIYDREIQNINKLINNNSKISQKNSKKKKELESIKNSTIDKYKMIFDNIDKNLNFNYINITRDKIILQKNGADQKDIGKFLNLIKDYKKYSIKNIEIENINNKENILKINLGAR